MTAAELLSMAAFADGQHAQAFPSFGSERMGAPVMAFCRIDAHPIRSRETITRPDIVIVQDATLLHHVDVFDGLSPEGYVVINSALPAEQLGITEFLATLRPGHACVMPASDIGLMHVKQPIANTPLLGGFAAITGLITLVSIETAIRRKFFGPLGEMNVAAAREAYDFVVARVWEQERAWHHARPN